MINTLLIGYLTIFIISLIGGNGVSDNVYGPTKEISEKLLKEFNINAIFYNPDSFENLKSKVTEKTKMILVENPGSITFEFQDLFKIVSLA